jgi:3-dehydrosphinganine reductase
MMTNFDNKNILITGGSSGIGFALACKYADENANVWFIARNEQNLIAAKNEIQSINKCNVDYFVGDVTEVKDIQKVLDYFKSRQLNLDLLINSAGVVHPGEFVNMDLEKFHWMMNTNFFGTVNTIKILLPLMPSGSHIVNISSMAGLLGVYGYSAYGASKFAVRGFSDALRSELKMQGIRLSIVFPPDTDTPQLTYENQFKPEITKEISGTSGALSAEKVAEIIVNGVKRNHYVIIPGFESKLIYHVTNLLGKLTYPLMDVMVNSAARKVANNRSKSH